MLNRVKRIKKDFVKLVLKHFEKPEDIELDYNFLI